MSASLRKFLLENPDSGACALVEFLLLDAVMFSTKFLPLHGLDGPVARVVVLIAAAVLGIMFFTLWVIHSAVVIGRRRWDPWFSLLSLIIIFFLSEILAELIVSLFYLALHGSHGDVSTQLDNSVAAQFFMVLLVETMILAAIYGYLRLFRIKLGAIGIKKPRWIDPFYGLAMAPAYYLAYIIVVALASHFFTGLNVDQQQDIGFNNVSGGPALLLTFVSLVVLPPIAEEVMMRGFLYSGFKKVMKVIPAAILTSLLFASLHLLEGGSGGLLYIAGIDTFTLSLFLIYLREKTDSLWPSITLHAVKNGVAFFALFVLHAR